MSKREQDVWAFPTQTATDWIHGMSLRDYFAGQALRLILADTGLDTALHADVALVALGAYAVADAMMKERSK